MVKALSCVLLLSAILRAAPMAEAQEVEIGGLRGILVNGQAALAADKVATTLYTVPAAFSYIVISFCSGHTVEATLSENTIGNFLSVSSGGCTSLVPGFVVPGGEILSCTADVASTANAFCSVSGVLTRNKRVLPVPRLDPAD